MKTIEYSNPWFQVVKDGKFHYVKEKNANNGAVILIMQDNESFIFVEQYRNAIAKKVIEAPRGYGENNENSLDAALREAYEETGYKIDPKRIIRLGSIYPNSAILSSKIDLYFAEVSKSDLVDNHDDEINKIIYIPKNELKHMLENEYIEDAFSISAVCFWLMKK